jgi:hypothetical protein
MRNYRHIYKIIHVTVDVPTMSYKYNLLFWKTIMGFINDRLPYDWFQLSAINPSMWCLNDSTVDWLRNSGGSKFQVTMVLGRNGQICHRWLFQQRPRISQKQINNAPSWGQPLKFRRRKPTDLLALADVCCMWSFQDRSLLTWTPRYLLPGTLWSVWPCSL